MMSYIQTVNTDTDGSAMGLLRKRGKFLGKLDMRLVVILLR